jgi:predicted transcriptional regulator
MGLPKRIHSEEDTLATAPMPTDAPAAPSGSPDLAELTAEIVSAYVAHNPLSAAQLPEVITAVGTTLREKVAGGQPEPVEEQEPAVPIKKSVTRDAVICLECGKRFRSIRRHLSNAHGLEPAEYRAKWGLPRDYPLTAPSYAERRSELAKSIGLGRKAKK